MNEENGEQERRVMSPADIAKKHNQESEDRKEAASFRFPEGSDFPGKIIKAEDTLSQRKKTPCYEIEVQTKEKNKKGKKVNITIRFMKNDKSMGFFYAFLELAGADLSKLRFKKQETLDEDIQELLETLEDENPKIVFNCAPQDAPSTYNNYYVNKCDKVLVTEEKAEKPEKTEKPKKSKKPEESKESDSKDTAGNSDSAFDDEDDD